MNNTLTLDCIYLQEAKGLFWPELILLESEKPYNVTRRYEAELNVAGYELEYDTWWNEFEKALAAALGPDFPVELRPHFDLRYNTPLEELANELSQQLFNAPGHVTINIRRRFEWERKGGDFGVIGDFTVTELTPQGDPLGEAVTA